VNSGVVRKWKLENRKWEEGTTHRSERPRPVGCNLHEKEPDLTPRPGRGRRRAQRSHGVHSEEKEKIRTLKTAGCGTRTGDAKNTLRSGLRVGTPWLLRRLDVLAGLFDAALHEFGLHFRLLTLEEVDFRFKGPVTRKLDLDAMFSRT
jgi:hypothetical protein